MYLSFLVVSCSELPSLENGQIAYSDSTTSPHEFGTVAEYMCNTGFGLSGEAARTCVDDSGGETTIGIWNGTAPTCECKLL